MRICEKLAAASFLLRVNSGKGIKVLCYHTVIREWQDPFIQWPISVTLGAFEAQMKYLKKRYRIISMREVADVLAGDSGGRHASVLITFDDGYRSNYQEAWPLMKSMELPMTVFVSTGFMSTNRRMPTFMIRCALSKTSKKEIALPRLGRLYSLNSKEAVADATADISEQLRCSGKSRADDILDDISGLLSRNQWDEYFGEFQSDQLMSWEEVKELAGNGVMIGAHTHNHVMVSRCQGDEDRHEELCRPRMLLSRHGINADIMAYPNGKRSDISTGAIEYARTCGYRYAFTTIPGRWKPGLDSLFLPRISGQVENMDAFKYLLERNWIDLVGTDVLGRRPRNAG